MNKISNKHVERVLIKLQNIFTWILTYYTGSQVCIYEKMDDTKLVHFSNLAHLLIGSNQSLIYDDISLEKKLPMSAKNIQGFCSYHK